MAFIQRQRLSLTTNATGDATGYFDKAVVGKIRQIVYTKDGTTPLDNGSTITFTNETTGESIWTEANVNASAVRAPRIPTHSTAGAASLYAGSGTAVNDHIAVGGDRVKVVIASGGNTKIATFDLIYE